MQQGDRLEISHPEQCARSTLQCAERPSQPSSRTRRRTRSRKDAETARITLAPVVEVDKGDDADDGSTTAESEQEANTLHDAAEDQASETAATEEEEFPEDTAAPQTSADMVEAEQSAEAGHVEEPSKTDDTTPQPEMAEEQVIYGLAKLLKHMARASKPSVKKSCFQSVRLPKVTLNSYASRIHKYFRCTDECFVLCLVYIDRIVKHNPHLQVTDLTCHRLLLTGCMVAAKFHDDEYASNEYFARVGGIDPQEMNILEAEFLQLLNWKLYVGGEEYNWFLQTLRRIP